MLEEDAVQPQRSRALDWLGRLRDATAVSAAADNGNKGQKGQFQLDRNRREDKAGTPGSSKAVEVELRKEEAVGGGRLIVSVCRRQDVSALDDDWWRGSERKGANVSSIDLPQSLFSTSTASFDLD